MASEQGKHAQFTSVNELDPKKSVDRYNNDQAYEMKQAFRYLPFTVKKMNHAMMLIARCCFFFTVLQFVAITRYYASLRLVKKKQQRTLSTIQLIY